MIQIKEINNAENKIIEGIVSIHMLAFKNFFLTFLGKEFLKHMYQSYILHSESTIFVAQDESNQIVGFVACSKNMSNLYKFMIKKKLVQFAWYSWCALIRKPVIFMKLIKAFLKPNEVKREENYIEISSIGVHPECKSIGIGTLLLDEVKQKMLDDTVEYINLETDANNNDDVNKFYLKNGFILFRKYETNEGRVMNEYRCSK
ncbi:MAG: GNAT family N-acetyltransferase [Bacillota bacterium]